MGTPPSFYNAQWQPASGRQYVPTSMPDTFSPELNVFQYLTPRLDNLDRLITAGLTTGNVDETLLNTEMARTSLAIKNPFANVNSPTLIAKEHAELKRYSKMMGDPGDFPPIKAAAKVDDDGNADKDATKTTPLHPSSSVDNNDDDDGGADKDSTKATPLHPSSNVDDDAKDTKKPVSLTDILPKHLLDFNPADLMGTKPKFLLTAHSADGTSGGVKDSPKDGVKDDKKD